MWPLSLLLRDAFELKATVCLRRWFELAELGRSKLSASCFWLPPLNSYRCPARGSRRSSSRVPGRGCELKRRVAKQRRLLAQEAIAAYF